MGFNPTNHEMEMVQDWYKLSNLPSKYWEPNILEEIGNLFGTFVCAKKCKDAKEASTYVRLCVEKKPVRHIWSEIELIS